MPKEDRHIIVTVHYYEPHEFTHQGATLGAGVHQPVGHPLGQTPRISRRSRRISTLAQAWAKQNDRPILLGEFGAYDKAPQEDRIKYTAAVARAAEKRGWAWTYWQFDSNFIVYDIDKDAWNEPIYRALVPPGARSYFLPDRRSISEANFEPFLSIFTRRWRTPVLLGAVVGDLERVGAENFQRLVESLLVDLRVGIALGAARARLA